jgi:hypothetical protein
LPAIARLYALDPPTRDILRAILLDLRADARVRAEKSWRQHKAPMANYWAAISVYSGHLARALLKGGLFPMVDGKPKIMASASAIYAPWGEHPKYPVDDWKYEVASGETRQGY